MRRSVRTEAELLRKCPVCSTPVSEAQVGLRDYRWLGDALPGRVGAMDIDFLLTQSATNRALVIELKRPGEQVPQGQRLAFAQLRRMRFDVWVVWTKNDGHVLRSIVQLDGLLSKPREITQRQLASLVGQWWNRGV